MTKKEMNWKVLWKTTWKCEIADETEVATKLIKDGKGCCEEVSSIKEKGKR